MGKAAGLEGNHRQVPCGCEGEDARKIGSGRGVDCRHLGLRIVVRVRAWWHWATVELALRVRIRVRIRVRRSLRD